MLYPRTSRLVRTNAYFIPAFAGLGQDVPLTSKAIQGDITFQRDMRKLQELQARMEKLKALRARLNEKYPTIDGVRFQSHSVVAVQRGASAASVFNSVGVDHSKAWAKYRECGDRDMGD